jgi:transaldolase
MRLFLHSGDVELIRREGQRGTIRGVTVDQSALLGKSASERRDWLVAIAAAVHDGPVSVEAAASDADGMVDEAVALSALAPNLVLAVAGDSEGRETVRRCAARGIATHITGCRRAGDTVLAAWAGARWLSPLAGPLPAGEELVIDLPRMAVGTCRAYGRGTRVLVGPLRELGDVVVAAAAGADAVSVVYPLLQRLLERPAGAGLSR